VFARLGTWCHDRRWLVVGLWVAALLVGNGVASAVGDAFRDEFNLPDSESKTGFDILDEHFGGEGTGITGTIVFEAPQGVDDPEVRSQMEDLFAFVDDEFPDSEIVRVESPYEEGNERFISSQGDRAGQIAYADVEFDEDIEFPRAEEIRNQILDRTDDIEGVNIELGGFIFAEFEEPSSEALGVGFAIVILIVAFGSVLAMGLPIGVALFGIGIGSAIITLLSQVLTIPDFATFLGIMIGLGVGIDYALLVVTRFREQYHAGHTIREAVGIAMDTAGRSVLFAGTTVVISLLGMLIMNVTFVSGLALGAAAVVAITVAASLTLLPALIGIAGRRVELTRWRGLIAAGFAAIGLVGIGLGIPALTIGFAFAVVVLVAGLWATSLKREVHMPAQKPRRETLAYRWSRVIQHRPWTSALVGAGILLVLAIPVLNLRLGFSDESNYAEDTTTKQAYNLLVEGFGPGYNGPFLLAAEVPDGISESDLEGVTEALAADPGVAEVSPPQLSEDGEAAIWNLIPTTTPQDHDTSELADRLRADVLPPVESELGTEVNVTGMVPSNLDFSDYLQDRYPYFFGAVLGLSFLLLMVVFRSVLVPVKAVIMNLLSIGAAYGVVVALFQWGWLSDLTNVEPAPIETWAPMMLFAIVFGLSMDYEVFLLSRIREEWHRTGDSRVSVADGLAATAKVITAAALIMVVVFGSFVLENDRIVKLMGTGLAVAVLLDATVIRMLLVPATMELLGDKNWWLPRWLDRILPNLDVEGHADPVPEEELPPRPEREREPAGAGRD
jgi:putative drug exporter of the RND superfamily